MAYTYDSLGSLWQKVEGAVTTGISYSTANRADTITETSKPNATLAYDACGSVTNNGLIKLDYGTGASCWSGEALTLVDATNVLLATYAYDANMKRVRDIQGASETRDIFSLSGELVEKRQVGGPRTDYISVGGQTIARVVITGASGTRTY